MYIQFIAFVGKKIFTGIKKKEIGATSGIIFASKDHDQKF